MFAVERKRRFLIIEWKEEGEPLTVGQEIMLEAMSYLPSHTVLILYGRGGIPSRYVRLLNGTYRCPEDCDKEKFQQRLDAWFAIAERKADV
jgi:hypothetical protein